MPHPRVLVERAALERQNLSADQDVLILGDASQASWLAERAAKVTLAGTGPSTLASALADGNTNLEGVEFEVVDPTDLPFADGAFDLVFASRWFEPGIFAEEAGPEIFRVLRRRGHAVLVDADNGLRALHPEVLEMCELARKLDAIRRDSGEDPSAGRKLAWVLRFSEFRDVDTSALFWTQADLHPREVIADLYSALRLAIEPGRSSALEELDDYVEFLEDRSDAWAQAGVWIATGRKR